MLAALVLGLAFVGLPASPVAPADEPDPVAGRRMYREGIRPSGEPLTAIVAGDAPILGTQFSCQSCHGRSGMGAAEGAWIVPAIAGTLLSAPSPSHQRPAYDRESLARALREGQDPTGRPFGPLMPRYRLSDDEVASLAAYLASLSLGPSPGADDTVIRFATVVTDDVSPDVRDAVLEVLRTYVDEKNRQTRREGRRPGRGTAPGTTRPTIFREWVLDEWTLTGPSEGWREQLETRYRSAPVFALLGGVSAGSWGPIGRFCESHEIPCLLPSTDLPDAAEGDFYTLHFSRGLELDADLVASHLAADGVRAVVQVFCGTAPARAAAALRSRLEEKGVMVDDLGFACEEPLPVEGLASRMTVSSGAAAVLWVGREELVGLERPLPPGRVYFSSTLLDPDRDGTLPRTAGPAYVAHSFRLPGEADSALGRFTVWARSRRIEIAHPRLQAEAFFAALAANHALTHVGRYLVRDYVLDMLDHAQGLAAYVPLYPQATQGPGQRFLTKGGHVLPVRDGRPQTDGAVWIAP